MGIVYTPRASPLHAARAVIGAAWCLSLVVAALLLPSPPVLATLLLVVLAAATLAGAGAAAGATLRIAVPFALAFALLNALWSHDGLTVLARLGTYPVLGEVDVTFEAVVFGVVFGLQIVVVLIAARLLSACVDPDELLRSARRVSFHSALSAALATRMVPVLAGDARRLADAQRARPGGDELGLRARAAIVGAVVGGALERSLDVAATLEVRGYGSTRQAPRVPRPRSRHDLAFATSALALLALALAAHFGGLAPFDPYPTVQLAFGATQLVLCAAIALVALLPFAQRLGVER